MSEHETSGDQPKSPIQEIVQPFVDLAHAPRALWGLNLSYLLEGMIYFGILTLLAMYFNRYVALDDFWAGIMVGVLTWGITFAMFFFGSMADRWGVRKALLISLTLLCFGRGVMAATASFEFAARGLLSPVHLSAMGGILLVILGYGMYQPAAYTAVKQFTSEKTAAMGYAMLYAVMNLGGWLPTFVSPPIRKAYGISGVFVAFTGFTLLALLLTVVILSRRTVEQALADAAAEREREKQQKATAAGKGEAAESAEPAAAVPAEDLPLLRRVGRWLAEHPLANAKFSFFIFCLIPVQTLFAYNWLVLPQYVERAFRGTWVGDNFEAAVNFNPVLIFILVPLVTAATQKRNVYNMMVLGTLVMSAPTFLLAIEPALWTLTGYILIMTFGEAMWQPRFLQYAAEIAPEGRTGAYMGVAQFPWFLTKMICSFYTGLFLMRYCPDRGPEPAPYPFFGLVRFVDRCRESETMWLIFAFIAVSSTVMLLLAKGWLGKDFKTKA